MQKVTPRCRMSDWEPRCEGMLMLCEQQDGERDRASARAACARIRAGRCAATATSSTQRARRHRDARRCSLDTIWRQRPSRDLAHGARGFVAPPESCAQAEIRRRVAAHRRSVLARDAIAICVEEESPFEFRRQHIVKERAGHRAPARARSAPLRSGAVRMRCGARLSSAAARDSFRGIGPAPHQEGAPPPRDSHAENRGRPSSLLRAAWPAPA